MKQHVASTTHLQKVLPDRGEAVGGAQEDAKRNTAEHTVQEKAMNIFEKPLPMVVSHPQRS